MATIRDKEKDKNATRQMILNPNRPAYSGGANWLGHGARSGKNAVVDYLLLDGASRERLKKEREFDGHRNHLRNQHDLLVTEDATGRLMFDRRHLGLSQSTSMGSESSKFALLEERAVQMDGLVEGAVATINVNAWERSAKARQLCIEHYGPTCVVCGFDFGATYGAFANGFILVHHIKPLAEVRERHGVDPVADLRPVCPNCHAVIHLGGGCLSIDEVMASLLGV